MTEIIYRPIKKSDFGSVSSLIEETFELADFVSDKGLLTTFCKSYLYDCLAEATFIEVAEKDKQVIGVIMGNADSEYSYVEHANYFFQLGIQKVKILLNKNKKELKHYNEMLAVYDKFYQKHKDKFDGVLTLFAVDESYQGHGIGKQLFTDLESYLKEKKVKRIYLFTDDSCNYGFYEYNGFKRLEGSVMSFGEERLTIYFYDYWVKN